ncbi:hypothetical protein RHECNPAF_1700082 [Rhizobium etli CNPAF512]|nr:hypothetical protein RHECNPAF_1700082 [Rhizobium etli CNPAF512]
MTSLQRRTKDIVYDITKQRRRSTSEENGHGIQKNDPRG